MRSRLLIAACCAAVAITGCAVRGLHKDQDRLRGALLQLCTNQVLDNLVRASNGLPIIHLDYTNANTQLTIDANGSFGDTVATNHANTIGALALSSVLVTRSVANTIASSLGLTRTNQVAVTATPVTTSNQLYDAYLSFLTVPGSLQVSAAPPPPGAAHVCRRFHDKYYWVPIDFREQYFELAAIVTAQRTKALLPLDPYYSVQIVGFADPNEINNQPNEFGATAVAVRIDRQLPITPGTAFIDGGEFNITLAKAPAHEVDYINNVFVLVLAQDSKYTDPHSLHFPMAAQLKLEQPPPPLTTKDLLDRIPFRTPQLDATSGQSTMGAASSTLNFSAEQVPAPQGKLPATP